jgi:hypothetical protein
MKRVIGIIFLTTFAGISTSHNHKPIEIDSPIIKVIDTGRLNIAQIVLTGVKMKELQMGKGKEKKGVIHFKDKECTLKELLAVESNLSKKHDHKDAKCLADSLDEAIDYIKESTAYYRELQREHKTSMANVVKQWSKQRDKHNSLLLKWAELDEHIFVKTHAYSAEKMYHFVDDLITMLNDVRFSCKKSNARFEKEMEEARRARNEQQSDSQKPKDEL